ncbi:Aldo/keto reductase [Sistotremastrum suecicum HHB10207 ss-3]|uniref:Aldo/keto reductase n=1 Tax=Sistotremastrum suecicum HHB10207 ss-3 TaxID=1314776 RepID=A0A165XQN3_9AGAM|nr:Aldo/keto reductase [Sistotremastrum suecicum HHB10207 ss-3]
MSTTNTPRSVPTKTLNDGHAIPIIGFGTGTALYGKAADAAVTQAINVGFRHLDGAQMYKNEDSLGVAISQFAPRSSLFVTTKLGKATPETVRELFLDSLKKLQVDYVDLFLIHTPTLIDGKIKETWAELEKLKEEGLAKSIGVSNFRVKDLQELLAHAKIVPAINQIEFHPYVITQAQRILDFSNKHNIVIESYGGLTSVFRRPGGPVDAVVAKIKQRLVDVSGNSGITDGQVILKWLQAKGIVAVTTSSKKERLEEYLETYNLPDLKSEEVQEIDAAGTSEKFRQFVSEILSYPYRC